MGQPVLLALDQGTTSTRAILFDPSGVELASHGVALTQFYPADGWVEHDPEEIYRASVAAMRAVLAATGRAVADVAALGITNQRETVVVWDRKTGRPVHRAIVWQDRRTAGTCERLRREGHEGRVAMATGLLLDPYFSATKISWILDNVEGARTRGQAGELMCGTIDTWLIWRLTGGQVHATDATNASRTLLMDLETQEWSPDLADLFGVPLAMLPAIRDSAGDFGVMAPEVLGGAVPIRGVAGDQQAALMGQGCVRPGEMKATYGTGCFLLLNTGTAAPRSGSRLLTTVAARLNGTATYALEGSIFVAGAAIQWLGEGLGIAGGAPAAEALAQQARENHGVVMVPAFTGLGAPWWDAEARGAIFGLTRDAGLAEIAQATFDACALQTHDLVEAMAADAPGAFGPHVELRIDGGMARSAWFSQRLSDLTGLTVCRAAYQEMTALGAAFFAGIGAGVYEGPEAVAALRPGAGLLRPRMDAGLRARAHERWREAVGRVRSLP